MDSLPLIITAAIVITVFCEGILWWLFQKKMKPLSFPHELDTSYFRFFSMPKLRSAAIIHTLFVTLCIVLCCWYLW